MDITLERIIQELKNQNKRQMDLTNFLGINYNSFGNWKNGLNSSYKKYIHAIASFLGVSVEYLQGTTDEKHPTNTTVTDNDIKFALFGGDGEITDEMLDEVKEFAKYVKSKYKKE